MLYVLQLFSPYMTSSFAKIPTLHGLCNQNVCRFSHAPEAVTIPDSHSSTSDSLFERPPEVNTTEFKLRLGSFKIDPFESGKLDGSQIYAAHVRIFQCHETDRPSFNLIPLIALFAYSSHSFPCLTTSLIVLGLPQRNHMAES